MRGPKCSFRLASAEDWPSIWPIFREVVRAGETYVFSPEMGEEEARSLWMLEGRDRQRTYVAEVDGKVVGTAQLEPNWPGLGDHVANAGWMISSQAAGRGIGRRFAEYVLEEARMLGFEAMQFNAVVETNERAVHLWKSLGFEVVGRVPGAFRHATAGRVAFLIMHRDLKRAQST
ncbi:MAG: GNAT family N-acetyltransferase [Planctomycetota bacterium]